MMLIDSLQAGTTTVDDPQTNGDVQKIKLYYSYAEMSCRQVLMISTALKLKFTMINITTDTYVKEDFMEKNPLKKVPALVDDEFVLWGSHAIMLYLVQKYPNETLKYPEELGKQMYIIQKLQFDLESLYIPFFNQYFNWLVFHKSKTNEKQFIMNEKLESFETILETIWNFESVTVADLALVTSISTIQNFGVDLGHYRYINKWFSNFKNTVYYSDYEEIMLVEINSFNTLVNKRKSDNFSTLEIEIDTEIEKITSRNSNQPIDNEYFKSLAILKEKFESLFIL